MKKIILKINLCVIVAALWLFSPVQAQCTPCPSVCTCSVRSDDQFPCFVNCTAANLRVVPKLPLNTSWLILRNNLIENIKFDEFSDLTALTRLDLRANQLTSLPDDLLLRTTSLNMSLSENKWICDCNATNLQLWLHYNDDLLQNKSEILCDKPDILHNQSIYQANLICASAFISCKANSFMFWDLIDYNDTTSYAVESCRLLCFSRGYAYSTVILMNTSCMCAHEDTSQVISDSSERNLCMKVCDDVPPLFACRRKVLQSAIYRSSPELNFSGIRPYLQHEVVSITVTGDTHLVDRYVWDFNDTTSIAMGYETSKNHKFAAPGSYRVKVIAQNGAGMVTHSDVLLVEEELQGFDLQCPSYTVEGGEFRTEISLDYGTKPKISWNIDGINNGTESETIESPYHYVSGSVIFEAISPQIFDVHETANPDSLSSKTQKFVLIFPGLWIIEDGNLRSWELVTPFSSYQREIKLQIYRPTCPTEKNLILPGCKQHQSPFSTCSDDSCSPPSANCILGLQYCYFNNSGNHCIVPIKACNAYSKDDTSMRHAYNAPLYTLVKEYKLNVQRHGLYQLFVDDKFQVKKDDVIGIGFDQNDTMLDNQQILNELPLKCMNSSLSSWRQSAMLFSLSSDQSQFNALSDEHKWVDTIWCDIRLHYAKPSTQNYTPSLADYKLEPGEHTYTASISNQASTQSTNCSFRIYSKDVNISLLQPPYSVENDNLVVYISKGQSTNFSVEVVGGIDSSANCTVANQDEVMDMTSSNSAENLSKTCYVVINFSESGNTTMQISARGLFSNSTLNIKVVTEDKIRNVSIIPSDITRLLSGTYKTFSTSYDTGANVSITWMIDGFPQFRFINTTYTIMFRKLSPSYQLTVDLANHVSSANASMQIAVNEMNSLKNLQFVEKPVAVEINVTSTFMIKVYVDENVNVTIEWTIDGTVVASHMYNEPQTGVRPESSIEQVQVNNSINQTFQIPGTKKFKVKVFNDYDEITIEDDIDAQSRIAAIDLELISNPVTNDTLTFESLIQPSRVGSNYTFHWNDGTDTESMIHRTTRVFSSRGQYNVSVTAMNALNSLSTWKVFQIFDRIAGLSVTTDEPTELGVATTIFVSMNTGYHDGIYFSFNTGNSTTINQSDWKLVYTYDEPGSYIVAVKATNNVSNADETAQVTVFSLHIRSIEILSECFSLSEISFMRALMPKSRLGYFSFVWEFGDGTRSTIHGNNTVFYNYSIAGYYEGNVTVHSLNTTNTDIMNFNVCVQEVIERGEINTTDSVAETGHQHVFSYIITGGTDVASTIDFGDGNELHVDNTSGMISHIYTEAGNHTVILSIKNLVSSTNVTTLAIVQDRITGLSLTTSSEYGTAIAKNHTVLYTAVYNGTDVSITWTFGDSSAMEYGQQIEHIYEGDDDYTITLKACNLIGCAQHNEQIRVASAVTGTSISPVDEIIIVGTTLTFNASASRDANFYWKVSPSTSWISNDSLPSFQHAFTTAGIYNVTLKAENKVSAEFVSVRVIVADEIDAIRINVLNTSNEFVPVDEVLQFEVELSNGLAVSTTTSDNLEYLTYEWKFVRDSEIVRSFSNSSTVEYGFVMVSEYVVSVNVSNVVSSQYVERQLNAVQRITNITLHKMKPPQNAAITGEAVTIEATVSPTSNVEYKWKAHKTFPYKEDTKTPSQFVHVYTAPAAYEIILILENQLDRVETTYTIYVQDAIQGLNIDHINAVKPFYVAHEANTLFHAHVDNGTNVYYAWQFIHIFTGAKSDVTVTDLHTINWNFTKIATYLLVLNASNLVSWDEVNITVHVLESVGGLSLQLSNHIVSTLDELSVNASFTHGMEPSLIINFGDGTQPITENDLKKNYFSTTHSYKMNGPYEILATAFNNASIVNATQTVYVHDRIVGLEIQGCSAGEFVSSDIQYNLTAVIEAGTDVNYTWSVTFSNGEIHNSSGPTMELKMTVLGPAEITLSANNAIHTSSKNITVTVQNPPSITINISNESSFYINQTVILNITLLAGTNVFFDVDFGDKVTVENSSDLIHLHVYADSGMYLITVRSHNNAAENVKSLKVKVGELVCSQPQLSFVGDGELQTKFYRSRKIYLETQIDTFGCTAYIVGYSWHVYHQDNCTNLLTSNKVNRTLAAVHTPLLAIPALTLEIGKYCVANTATYQDTPLSTTISTTIEVVSSPLVVIISGGTIRFVSTSARLVLDASSSFDPDLAVQRDLSYRWYCSSKPTSRVLSTSKADDNCIALNGEIIVMQASDLLVNYEYNFTVEASKVGKTAVSTWQLVIVVPDVIPTVAITCHSCRLQSSLQISSAHHLILLGSCDSCSRKGNLEYFWEASRRKSNNESFVPFVLNKDTTTTGDSGRYLVVRVGAMFSYYEYEFTLTIKHLNATGASTLVLYANKPPANGNCTIQYDGPQVYVLETLVRFACIGWEDEDISPLIYTILAKRYSGETQIDDFVIYRGTSSNYQAYLPLGFESNNFDLNIQILVEDELGTYTVGLNKILNVKLYDEASTIEWLRNKTSGELADLQKSSNPQVVADFAAGLITVLNRDSQDHGPATTDVDFTSRKEIRDNITRTVASLNTNNFDEIQQVAAVFKQCMKIPSEFQDTGLHNISMTKLNELAEQMPQYIDVASQTHFLSVTTDLIVIVSYMVDAINYHVYVTGEAYTTQTTDAPSTLSRKYREDMVETLMTSAVQLTDNVLEGKVEGEEAIFLNGSGFSSIGGRTTPTHINKTILNDGCYFKLPDAVFHNISDDTEIMYIFFVSEQNPYTFGYISSSLVDGGMGNISSRVPSLQFKFPDQTPIVVDYLDVTEQNNLTQKIKVVMAPSNRQFIEQQDTGDLANVIGMSGYAPRDSLNFQNNILPSLHSASYTIKNNNTNDKTSLYIMIVFEKMSVNSHTEPNPFVDVYFHYSPLPSASHHSVHLRLTTDTMLDQADHRHYTIYLNPLNDSTTLPYYYLNVTNNYEHVDINVGIAVYYSSCQYFDTQMAAWSSEGLSTSHETSPSGTVCYSDHLTSFGSFVINPPNTIDLNDIVSIDFSQNSVALIVVVVVFVLYLVAVLRSYQLDQRDIKSGSIIPLCGTIHPYKYEITVKTSPGMGSGTSANVGICVYGYESRTGAKHLYKEGSFGRGMVDVFQIASETSLGFIYKIKIWHDNTGLDPGWNVSRIMVKDLQNNKKYYFLLDCWLQVYPDDDDDTCLQKTVRAASDEEMSDFSLRFGTQLSYGWEDAHLWLSLIERPPRSNFTRVQRATCCATLIYTFMMFSAVWYQGYDDSDDFSILRWKDVAVGAIVSLTVFPINIFIVYLFKKSKCKATALKTWDNRAQTAQTVEILDEILDGRKNTSMRTSRFDSKPSSAEDWCTTPGTYGELSFGSATFVSSDDTGISTSSQSPNSNINVRRRFGALRKEDDDDDDFWDPFVSDGSFNDEDIMNTRPTNLRRTHKAKFQDELEISDDENLFTADSISQISSVQYSRQSLTSPESDVYNSDRPLPSKSYICPHIFMYMAYALCFAGIIISAFIVIVYGNKFGVEIAFRWLISLAAAFLESFFIIEPIKVVFLAVYVAMFTEQQTPEQNDNLVEDPFVETYEDIMKPCKIRPPGGFALEQCKEQIRKSARLRKLLLQFGVYLILLWSVVGFCVWDRDSSSYWLSWSFNDAFNGSSTRPHVINEANLYDIKTVSDIWKWMDSTLEKKVFDKNKTYSLDNNNIHNALLGMIRLRQQRTLPESCTISSLSSMRIISPDHLCITSSSNPQDKTSYYAGWSNTPTSSNVTWSYTPSLIQGFGYLGEQHMYDDSGYSVYLDEPSSQEQLTFLETQGWIDRLTKVLFVEFSQLNPATHWFTVSVIMFEIGVTGVVQPSHSTKILRLFTPSSAAYVDMFFIAFIGLIGIFLWFREIAKLWRATRSSSCYACITTNWKNIMLCLHIACLCSLFVYKEVYMEEVMRGYKENRTGFTNFYKIAIISEVVLYLAAILLAVLVIKTVRVLNFFQCWYKFGVSLSHACRHILAATVLLITLIITYAQLGFLVFGLNSTKVINEFQDFQNSLYTMVRLICGKVDTQSCFNAYPMFTIAFFLSYYLAVFIIFCRLFSAILIKEYKLTQLLRKRPVLHNPDYEIMNYMITRLKLRLGLVKSKQYRPTVHFEGMSTSSSSSFISIDSLGTCFTPERISQCSDASGVSSSDSGLGTPSDHSISLFDYLTLEHPPYEKPMDDLHLDYLYDRISSYSVDMLIHRIDRVNKICADVLAIESKLLTVTQKCEHRKALQGESNEIAQAVCSTTAPPSALSASGRKNWQQSNSRDDINTRSIGGGARNYVGTSSSDTLRKLPTRSTSSIDATTFIKNLPDWQLGSGNTKEKQSLINKRPHSDEGARISHNKSKLNSLMFKKTAW